MAPPTKTTQVPASRMLSIAVAVRTAGVVFVTLALSWLGFGLVAMVAFLGFVLYDSQRSTALRANRRRVLLHRQLLHDTDFRNLMTSYPPWVSFGDQEQALFLNSVLAQLWPMAKVATEQTIMGVMQGVFASVKPSFLTKLELDVVDLGFKPPSIIAVNLVELPEGVALDLGVKFNSDSNVVLAATAKPAIPMKVRVHKLSADARVRVLLAPLSDEAPFFEALSISLLEKPKLKFELVAPRASFGVVKLFMSFIRDLINNILVDMLLWPRKMVVPMVDVELPLPPPDFAQRRAEVAKLAKIHSDAEATLAKAHAAPPPWVATLNQVLLPLRFVFPVNADEDADADLPGKPFIRDIHHFDWLQAPLPEGLLQITVSKAEGLKSADLFSASDPYVRLFLQEKVTECKTTTKDDDNDPVWNEDFQLHVGDYATQVLHVVVMDKDTGSADSLLGVCDISLQALAPNVSQPITRILTANGKGNGRITLELCYKPFSAKGGTFESFFKPPKPQWSPGIAVVNFTFLRKLTTKKPVTIHVTRRGETDKKKGRVWSSYPTAPVAGVALFQDGFAIDVSKSTDVHFTVTIEPKIGSFDLDVMDIAGRGKGEFAYNGASKEIMLEGSGAELGIFACARVTERVRHHVESEDRHIFEPNVKAARLERSLSEAAEAEEGGAGGQGAAAPSPPKPANRRASLLIAPDKVAAAEAKTEDEAAKAAAAASAGAQLAALASGLPQDYATGISVAGLCLGVYALGWLWFLPSYLYLLLVAGLGFGAYWASLKHAEKHYMNYHNADEDKLPLDQLKPEATDSERLALLRDVPAWVQYPGVEKTEWLNEIVGMMWPRIKTMVKSTVNLQVATMRDSLPPFITSLSVDLNLGDVPLTINGVQAYTESFTQDRVVLDVDVAMAGDFYCLAKAGLGNFALPVELEDLYFEGRLRVTLRNLIGAFPCFTTAAICFVEVPSLDFKLSVAHLPLTSIPFVPSVVKHFAGQAMEQLELISPNAMAIDILDPNDVEISRHVRTPGVGMVRIWVERARNLRNVDRGGKSDPYVSLVLFDKESQKVRTNTIYDNLNPEWNAYFEFLLTDNTPRPLEFTVKDHDRIGKNQILGVGELNTGDMEKVPDVKASHTFPFTFKGKPAGSLDICFEFKPFVTKVDEAYLDHDLETEALGAVFVEVVRARNLPDGSAFVSATVGNKSKSTRKLSDKNPVFNEELCLPVYNIATEKVAIDLHLDRGLRKNFKESVTEDLMDLAKSETVQRQYAFKGDIELTVRLTLRTVSSERRGTATWESLQAELHKREEEELKKAELAEAEAEAAEAAGTPALAASVPTLAVTEDETGISGPTRPGFLLIHLIRGENLPAVNTNGFSDPYVVFKVGKHKKKSETRKRTVNPEWGERFDFKVSHPATEVVHLELKDKEHFHTDKKIDSFTLNVAEMKAIETTKVLKLKERGTLTIAVCFQEDLNAPEVADRKGSFRLFRRNKKAGGPSPSGSTSELNTSAAAAAAGDDDDDKYEEGNTSIDGSESVV